MMLIVSIFRLLSSLTKDLYVPGSLLDLLSLTHLTYSLDCVISFIEVLVFL